MTNGTKQNDAPFVAFYDMHDVTFFLPDEMANRCIPLMEIAYFHYNIIL